MAQAEFEPRGIGARLAEGAPLLLAALGGPVGFAAGLLGTGLLRERGKEQDALGAQEFAKQQRAEAFGGPVSGEALPELLDRAYQMEAQGFSSDIIKDRIDELQGIGGETRAAGRDAEALERALSQRGEDQTAAIRDDLRGDIRAIADSGASLRNIFTAPEDFAGDQARIFGYAKQLQPTGVLTEQDVQRIAGDPSIPGQIANVMAKYFKGEPLTAPERRAIERAAANAYQNNRTAFQQITQPYQRAADAMGLPMDQILPPELMIGDEELGPFLNPAPPLTTPPPLGGPRVTLPPREVTGDVIDFNDLDLDSENPPRRSEEPARRGFIEGLKADLGF